jgi:ATP sulfurylase
MRRLSPTVLTIPALRASLLAALVLACAGAHAQAGKSKALPRADFFDACPFTVAPPSVITVLDAKRWREVVGASRRSPPPYDPAATDFRHESIFIVALTSASNTLIEAALSTKKPERYDEQSGTLTLFYDVATKPASVNDMAAGVGQPCLVTWTGARKGLLQVVTRTSDGRYIAGARTAEKPKKKT